VTRVVYHYHALVSQIAKSLQESNSQRLITDPQGAKRFDREAPLLISHALEWRDELQPMQVARLGTLCVRVRSQAALVSAS